MNEKEKKETSKRLDSKKVFPPHGWHDHQLREQDLKIDLLLNDIDLPRIGDAYSSRYSSIHPTAEVARVVGSAMKDSDPSKYIDTIMMPVASTAVLTSAEAALSTVAERDTPARSPPAEFWVRRQAYPKTPSMAAPRSNTSEQINNIQ
jgi:hypothetical protein